VSDNEPPDDFLPGRDVPFGWCGCHDCKERRAKILQRERSSADSVAPEKPGSAVKADDGKLRYDLIAPEFEEEVAKGLTFGATKYADKNYLQGEGLELKRPLAALRRHLNALRKGEDFDKESGAHHAACVAINAMFIYELMTKKGRKF